MTCTLIYLYTCINIIPYIQLQLQWGDNSPSAAKLSTNFRLTATVWSRRKDLPELQHGQLVYHSLSHIHASAASPPGPNTLLVWWLSSSDDVIAKLHTNFHCDFLSIRFSHTILTCPHPNHEMDPRRHPSQGPLATPGHFFCLLPSGFICSQVKGH